MPMNDLSAIDNTHRITPINKRKSVAKFADNSVVVIDGLIDERQLSQILGRSVPAIQKDRYAGTGPSFVKLGRRMVRYRIEDVQEWLESRVRRSTSDPGPTAA